jgi:uncharacterized protein
MERIRTKPTNGKPKRGELLKVFSELTNRMGLASQLGYQYSGDRDVYEALGYPTTIKFSDYYNRYDRQDMAKAIIDRPVKASWKGELSVIESVSDDKTPFEKSWIELSERLKLKSVFIRADKLTGIGQYSILLLGLNDVRTVDDFKNPVPSRSNLKLIYVKPLSQASAEIEKYDNNVYSERYGLPLMYKVSTSLYKESGTAQETTITVHYSRIVHLVEDVMEDEVHGTPRLRAVYNRLMDLEKLIGGDAEMFWRGARPGYTGKLDENFQITDEGMEDLQDQIDEFEHNLRRVLINEGIDYKALEQQIADPLPHVDIQMQMISAVTGIPKRILVGSERGELSSAQDKQEWIAYVTSRREEQNEPMILRPFIDKCLEIKILPKPKDGKYLIVWDKLFSLSDTEKVNMGKTRAVALKEYSLNPMAQELMPFEMFMEFFLALDKTQIERTTQAQEENIRSERPLTEVEKALLERSGYGDREKPDEEDMKEE